MEVFAVIFKIKSNCMIFNGQFITFLHKMYNTVKQ